MKRLALSVSVSALLCSAAFGSAEAFTYDGQASLIGPSNLSMKYQDPEAKLQNNLSSNNLSSQPGSNSSSGKFGNFSFKFSSANSSNGFGGGPSQFAPSGNSAFGSPFGPNNLDLALGTRH